MDKCMTSIEDSTCTSSYGSTTEYISSGGTSLVGWVQQLSESCHPSHHHSVPRDALGRPVHNVQRQCSHLP